MNLFAVAGFRNAVTPWVLLALGIALLLAFLLTLKAWREARRSPYFFQRRQALQQMQSYSLASLALLVATAAVVAYGYSPTLVYEPRTKVLANAKPTEQTLVTLPDTQIAVSEEAIAQAPTSLQNGSLALAPTSVDIPQVPLTPQLPSEFNLLQPSAEINNETLIADIIFSTAIDDDYTPVSTNVEFSEGSYTIYATFDYSAMEDGMTWAWVWKRDGQVVGGGEQHWTYGQDGPGYIYFKPEEGFTVGDYSLEVWINGEIMTQTGLEVTAGVANQ